jgi:threonine aldolase
MGNEIALAVHGRPGREVVVESLSHIMTAEGGAPAALAGVTLRPLDSKGGRLDPDRVEAALVLDDDPHHAPTVLACAENTHNRLGGRVYPLDAFVELAGRLKRHGIPLHLDGARLWNAAAASGHSTAELAGPADSVMVCFSKGSVPRSDRPWRAPRRSSTKGGASANDSAGACARRGILAAGCRYALDHHRERLVDDHRRARRLAELVPLPVGASILGGQPETNIIIWDLPVDRFDVFEIRRRLALDGVHLSDFGPGDFGP